MPDEPLPRPATAEDFRVGDWLVQPSLDRLSRGETLIHLRPQLTNLLVLLARHAGKAVTKDLILKEVWGSQYVGESALTRCVTEIRQAFDDDARRPKIIETIPKRGYRLVAPVEFLPEIMPTPGGRPASSPPSVRPVPVMVDSGPSQAEAESGRQRVSRRVRWTVLLATAAAVVVGVTLGAGDWLVRPVLSDRDTVLLADVSNTTGERVFDDTLRLALAVNLEQAPFLRILPQETVRGSLVRMGRDPGARLAGSLALDVCRRESAAVVLSGSIARLGSRYAIGIEALACRTGESVGRALVQVETKEQVLAALEQAATRIRRSLGESRASLRQHDVPLVRATTPSLEALQALTLGDESRDHARIDAAHAFYRQATELDPEFALAWARRGAAAWNLGLGGDAVPAFRRAYALRERVSPQEAFYIAGHYHTLVEGDPARAVEIYRTWRRQYPGSPIPPTNLTFILAGTMGRYDAALPEAREAVRLAPYSSLSYSNLVVAYLGLNRIPEARQALTEASRAGVTDWLMHRRLFDLAMLDGDRVALEREIRWAEGDPQATLFTLRARASAAMTRGRLKAARQLWSEALAKSAESGGPRQVAETRRSQAEAEALVGDPQAARVAVEAGLAADRGATSLAFSAVVFALVGDGVRARKLLDEMARHPQPDLASPQVWLPVARALVGVRLGQPDESLRLLQPVAPYERGAQFSFVPLGVRAIVARSARRPADAAAACDEILRLRAVAPSSPWLAFAELGLAQALRESGDSVRSAAAYQSFLDSWKDADLDAPLLKVARRERAALSLH